MLAAGRGVDHLLQALVHHVAVALHREHEGVGLGPLHAGGERRRAAVQRLEHLDVEVVRRTRCSSRCRTRRSCAARHRARRCASRIERIAIGSPQPGQRWCSPTSMSAGVKSSTRRAGSIGGASVGMTVAPGIVPASSETSSSSVPASRSRRYVDVEVGRDAEARAVEAEPPMNCTGRAPEHREAHVVDHLALVVLVDRDGAARRRPRGHDLGREREQRDRPHVADRRPSARSSRHRGADVLRRACRTRRRPPRRRRQKPVSTSGSTPREHRLGARRAPTVVVGEVVADVVALLAVAERRHELRALPVPPVEPSSAQSLAGERPEVDRRSRRPTARCARGSSRRRPAPGCATRRRGGTRSWMSSTASGTSIGASTGCGSRRGRRRGSPGSSRPARGPC